MEWSKHARDDFIGGLVSAAVAIPLAMGYGMFALASLGENYFADGALAGLGDFGFLSRLPSVPTRTRLAGLVPV